MKRSLIIGANSFVGKALVEPLQNAFEVAGTYHLRKNHSLVRQEPLDITDEQAVHALVRSDDPDVVILAAAVSSTGAQQEQLDRVNVQGVRNVVSAVRGLKPGAKVVFFSSSQVFDGANGPYRESDTPNPLNAYGSSKLAGERIVQMHANHLILRCSIILGATGADDHDNFVTTFLRSQQPLTVFSDVCRTPTYVGDIGPALLQLLAKDARGIVHVSCGECISYAEMAKRIGQVFGVRRQQVVESCTNPSIPAKSCLDNSLLLSLTGSSLTGFNQMLEKIKGGMVV